MGDLKILTSNSFIEYLGHTKDDRKTKYCFILGSGCSVENGISTGWALANKWYGQLKDVHTHLEIENWKLTEKIDESDLGFFYSKIFKFRFSKDPQQGYKAINHEIEKGRIGFGHMIFAQLILKTTSNVVITTNFDTLVEETLYTFTEVRPIICGHESIAKYAKPSTERPLIIKIHRDRFMDPLNLDHEISSLKPEWHEVLDHIFNEYIPIFIGYGGNDGSLMGYLKNITPCKNMFWCTNSSKPLREDIQQVISHHNGRIVLIESFNRLMLRLMPLYHIISVPSIVQSKALRLEKEYISTLITLTRDVHESGNVEEKAQVNRIVENFDQNSWWQWEIKVQDAETIAEKRTLYLKSLKCLPHSFDLNYQFACFLVEQGHNGEAAKHFKKALKIDPNSSDAWYSLGLTYRKLSNYDQAIDCYKKTVELESTYAAAWNGMGICYHSKALYEEAIKCYRRALVLKPDDAHYWNNLGFSYKVINQTTEALRYYQKALKLQPTLAKAFFNVANVYYDQQMFKKAIQFYKKALSHNAQDADTIYNLGLSYEDIGYLKKAKEMFAIACKLDPNDPLFKKAFDRIYSL